MKFEICSALDEISATQWNALVVDNNPFLRHEFLVALERHACAAPKYGWHPRHLLARDDNDRLIAAAPAYIKENSYGEFVFDHAWADAYQRNGLRYYPKLVSSIPYTPATGQRVLIAPDRAGEREWIVAQFSQLADQLAVNDQLSSTHWLFISEPEVSAFERAGLVRRIGVQFHWYNRGYENFDQFLAQLTSKRRKNIRRERKAVTDQKIKLRVLHGDEVTEAEWRLFTRFYNKTFEERYSLPTLNFGFFSEIGNTLPKQVILVLAYDGDECVAGALMYRSDNTLYGRHWGCERDYHSLHFEACYYQGIEYCIRHGLQRFEPGAQGEHKIWRGFLPTLTYSMHRIYHPGFDEAIKEFLQREEPAILDYKQSLEQNSPYRAASCGGSA
ncbi:MAG: GNAT family N-acetyltransferase [Chromatiales bacterium]|nr:GNAT family N-acetyltransferase [Chromatiales bacterium]